VVNWLLHEYCIIIVVISGLMRIPLIDSGLMHLNEEFEEGDFYFTNENLSAQVHKIYSSTDRCFISVCSVTY